MSAEILSVLPNLSVGVISVLALGYVTKQFLDHLSEREEALRKVESEVRTSLVEQLGRNTVAISEMTRTHERVINALERPR